MLVHRYIGPHLKESLLHSELKVSKVSEFNDPFELRYRYTGEFGPAQAKKKISEFLESDFGKEQIRNIPRFVGLSHEKILQIIEGKHETILNALISQIPNDYAIIVEAIQKQADGITRVLCFSRPTDNPHDEILRWSHYTNRHMGARLWINLSVQDSPLRVSYPVKYQREPVSIEFEHTSNSDYMKMKMREVMTTKSECWRYEGEMRSFIVNPHYHTKAQDGHSLDYVRINLDGIERIDFGIRFPESEIGEIIELVKGKTSTKVQFYRAFCSPIDFSIKYAEVS